MQKYNIKDQTKFMNKDDGKRVIKDDKKIKHQI